MRKINDGLTNYQRHWARKKNDVVWMAKKRAMVRKAQDKARFGAPREEIIESTCKLCGGNHRLVIHHINGEGRPSQKPDNRRENLITLCTSCHTAIHNAARVKAINKAVFDLLVKGLIE